jgi:hypothetical protein
MSFRIPNTDNPVEVRQAFQAISQMIDQLESRQFDMFSFRCGAQSGPSTINIQFTKSGETMWRIASTPYGNGPKNSFESTDETGIINVVFHTKDGSDGITRLVATSSMLVWSVPYLARCVNMEWIDFGINHLEIYSSGILTNMTRLTHLDISANILTVGSVNAILTDLLTNQRMRKDSDLTCSVDLSGGTNAAPTGAGLAAKAALIAAGWTVTTN